MDKHFIYSVELKLRKTDRLIRRNLENDVEKNRVDTYTTTRVLKYETDTDSDSTHRRRISNACVRPRERKWK